MGKQASSNSSTLPTSVLLLQCGYESVRRWRVRGGSGALPTQQRVHTTLLEYGPLGGNGGGPVAGTGAGQLQVLAGDQSVRGIKWFSTGLFKTKHK